MTIVHLVAHLQARDVSLVPGLAGERLGRPPAGLGPTQLARRHRGGEGLGQRVWHGLRGAFPQTFGAVLMPDHLHLVSRVKDPAQARRTLAHVLRGVSAGLGPATWQPVPPSEPVPDLHHLRRVLRYVALNPCRAHPQLAADPLEWLPSTHRDLVGATVDPWVRAEDLAALLREPVAGFAERWHRYVSTDPSVHLEGTPLPALEPGLLEACTLPDLRRAVSRACCCPEDDLQRRGSLRDLLLMLAHHLTGLDRTALATECGLARTTLWRARQKPVEDRHVRAVLLTLADPRLRGRARPDGDPREMLG